MRTTTMTTGTTGDSGNASTMAYFGGGLMDSLDSGYCNNAGGLFFLFGVELL